MSYLEDVQVQGKVDLQNLVMRECEYPGQTLMVALAITLAFPSYQKASYRPEPKTPMGMTCTQASGSEWVPGSGTAVYRALDLLKEGILLNLSGDDMVTRLHEEWSKSVENSSFEDRLKIGMAKAMPFEDVFKKHWGIWKNISIEEQKLEQSCAV